MNEFIKSKVTEKLIEASLLMSYIDKSIAEKINNLANEVMKTDKNIKNLEKKMRDLLNEYSK